MRLIKIKHRTPALDTRQCYCINNYLWNKDKVQIINNGTEMLVPKYYCPMHIGQKPSKQLANARYRAGRPLKLIKTEHERQKREFKKRGRQKESDRIYTFKVAVNATEYKMLWNFLYKDVRDPLKDKVRIQTIEEIIEKRERNENGKH